MEEDESWSDTSLNDRIVEFENARTCIILHYATWCVHCQQFKPEWMRLQRLIDELQNADVCAVAFESDEEAPEDMRVVDDEVIDGYPTIIIWRTDTNNRKRSVHYDGKRTADAILAFALEN